MEMNYLFYSNLRPSAPEGKEYNFPLISGDFLDNIHKTWKGNYEMLERHHGYIQYLFPLFERFFSILVILIQNSNGMNHFAKKLKKDEAALMRTDVDIGKKFVLSYE